MSMNAETALETLEREKLILEIQQLKGQWWKKPAYVLAALPTLLAVLSVVYGFANGYFQAAAVKLENQKHDLQVEIREFSKEREELVRQNKELNDQISRQQAQLKELPQKFKEWKEKIMRGENAEPPEMLKEPAP